MYNLPDNTRVTIVVGNDTHLGIIVRSRELHVYDVQLEDGSIIKGTWNFYYQVPSIIIDGNEIPKPWNIIDTNDIPSKIIGNWWITSYQNTENDIDATWMKFRQYYPSDALGVIWSPTDSVDGYLTEREIANCLLLEQAVQDREARREKDAIQKAPTTYTTSDVDDFPF